MLCKLGTGRVPQHISATLALYTNMIKNDRIQVLLFRFFCERNFPVTLQNGVRFLRLGLDNSQAKIADTV